MNTKELDEQLEALLGFKHTEGDRKDFLKKIKKLITTQGWESPDELAFKIKEKKLSKEQEKILARELTIGETYFFRYRASFEALANEILPNLLKQETIKIWSAGCSSGEEPYSLTMTLDQLNALDRVKIIATDINQAALDKAKTKIYSRWSFRGVSEEIIDRYFKQDKNGWQFQLKAPIEFYCHNLVADPYPAECDLILCNNVLIYFSLAKIHSTVENIARSLKQGGWFLTSPVEVPYITHPELKPVTLHGVTFFQKKQPLAKVVKEVDVAEFTAPVFTNPNNEKEKCLKSRIKILFERDQSKEAIDEMEVLFSITKWTEKSIEEYEELLFMTIRHFCNHGAFEKARLWCQTLLEISKTSAFLYFLYGIVLQEQNEQALAQAAFQNTLFLDPGFIMAHFFLGTLKKLQGKEESALRFFSNVKKLLDPFPDKAAIYGTDLTKEQLLHILSQVRRP